MGILKDQIGSIHGLKGEKPSTLPGATATSQTHYKSDLEAQTPEHSKFDYDGQKPTTVYTNPETGASI